MRETPRFTLCAKGHDNCRRACWRQVTHVFMSLPSGLNPGFPALVVILGTPLPTSTFDFSIAASIGSAQATSKRASQSHSHIIGL